MPKTLIEKLNEITDAQFEYLRLSEVNVNLRRQSIEVCLIYPEDKTEQVRLSRERIEAGIRSVLKSNAEVTVKLRVSHFDEEFFRSRMFEFLRKYPSISCELEEKNLIIDRFEGKIIVTLVVEQSVYDYLQSGTIVKEIETFIAVNYCEPICLKLDSFERTEFEIDRPPDDGVPEIVLDDPEGRFIRPQNVEEFIGNIVYDKVPYIEDARRPKDYAVLCGKVEEFQELARKPKDGVPVDKKYYKFVLRDFTGAVNCIYFPSKKTADQITLLKSGKEIVARGKLVLDEYRKDGSLTFMPRDISLCTLPEDFKVNKARRRVDEEYHYVFPKPYVVTEQRSLFEQKTVVPAFALGKTFCVFDIETTGLSPDLNEIIEIGAVKMIDGVIRETFSTFIDPLVPIPEKIVKLTSITDDDVRGQYTIDQVLPDFYKFSDGTIMVGQNVQFDYSFISISGAKQNIYFENELMDTLALARKYVPGLRKYNLGALVDYFGIKNKGAHRAIYDAIATAELLLKIIELMG